MISIQWTSSINDDGTCTYIGKSDLQDFTITSRCGTLISMEPQIVPALKTSLEAMVAVESIVAEINKREHEILNGTSEREPIGLLNDLND